MSTLQISAPISTQSLAGPRRTGPVLRMLHAVVEAIGETNRRKAEREIARVARSYGIVAVQPRD
ncbi:hypothetical protein [Microvirga mediterraneensis]|uniref:Uncharacterized protein n=1 Tax=Microvirga mediterraneensis TaxID=2754695 RepID=A0A838BPH0_9HYPH|nr:hypothetical protein [Microvirga mediterraneensis]MBA1157634.1 hypothetical protein [Microvirga mediterraneensis]